MVYKRYVYKGGKKFGPYYYESYRDGDKIRKRYLGNKLPEIKVIEKHKKNLAYSPYIILCGIFLILILAGWLFYTNLQMTGRATLDVSPVYSQGEAISGAVKLSLKAGELIPASSTLAVNMAGEERQFSLSELLSETATEGSFYAENMQLTGSGQGYGIVGTKTTYPDISFKLKIIKEKAETPAEATIETPEIQPETPSEENANQSEEQPEQEQPAEQPPQAETLAETPTEQPSQPPQPASEQKQEKKEENAEKPAKEEKSEKKEEKQQEQPAPAQESAPSASAETPSTSSESSSTSSGESAPAPSESAPSAPPESSPAPEAAPAPAPSPPSESPITGSVVGESEKQEKIIDATISKDKPFVYTLEQGESAEIVQGSVKTSGNKKVDEIALNLQVSNNQLAVTTSYSETETGFGAEFLSDETTTMEISLDKMNITAKQGTLAVSLSYNGAEIIQTSAEINVVQQNATETPAENATDIIETPAENATNITQTENITETNITINETNITLPESNITNAILPELNATNVTEINITEQNLTELNITELNVTKLNITQANLTLVKNIPDITIEKNGNFSLNLSEYFAGAESYEVSQLENISINLSRQSALIMPEANFTGTRNTSITAYKENESIREDFVINVQEINATIETIQYQAVIGQPVRWEKRIKPEKPENITLKLPASSKNITIKKIAQQKETLIEITGITGQAVSGMASAEIELNKEPKFITFFKKLFRFTGKVTEEGGASQTEQEIEINITAEENAEYEVQYYTDAPYTIEENISRLSKRIIVLGPEINYINILTFATIDEIVKIRNEKAIKLYWLQNGSIEIMPFNAYDTNNNSFIDYIEWLTPHLSNQTFMLVIEISRAEHLDKDRVFISDIYNETYKLDGIWSEEIPNKDYVRVTFMQNLTSENDITIYPRIVKGNPKIRVYEVNGSEIIVEFPHLVPNEYNQVLLTNFTGNQDTFDLHVIGGGIEIEHIVDAKSLATVNLQAPSSPQTINQNDLFTMTCNWTQTGGGANENVDLNFSFFANGDATNKTINKTTDLNTSATNPILAAATPSSITVQGLNAGSYQIRCIGRGQSSGNTRSSANMTITVDPPTIQYCGGVYNSSMTNWNISNNVRCDNETILITKGGNMTIYSVGNLSLYNVTLNFSMTADGSSMINKTASGGLWIYDNDNNASTTTDASFITSNNTNFEYDFWVFGNGNNDNFTLRNSRVSDAGYGSGSNGIRLTNVNNSIILNNNITDSALYGLYLISSSSNNITGNYINTTASSGYGIYLDGSLSPNTDNIISSNTITTNGSSGYGIYFVISSNNNITSNTITTSNADGMNALEVVSSTIQNNIITTNGTSGGIDFTTSSNRNIILNNTIITNGTGIQFYSSSNNNNITNNTITARGSGIIVDTGSNFRIDGNTITTSGSTGYGIYLVSDILPNKNNNILGNTITTNGTSAYGIYLLTSNSNNISSNTITTNGSTGYGIYLKSSSNSNNITSNIITTRGLTSYGVLLNTSHNNTLLSNRITNSTYYGIYSTLSNGLNLTANSMLNTTSLGYDIYLNSSSNFVMWQNGTSLALNGSFNKANVNITNNGNLTAQYYARAYVKDAADVAISSATVNSTNVLGNLDWLDLTAATGYTAWQATTDFVRNSTTDINYNLHNATANKTDYQNNSVTYNVSINTTNHTTFTITLSQAVPFNCSTYSTGNILIESNVVCSNITLNVSGNITIASGGNLSLYNVTLNFSMTADGSSMINKTASGGLWIYDNDNNASTTTDASFITSNNTNFEYDFWVFGNGNNDNFTLRNSRVSDAGYGSGSNGIRLTNVNNTKIINNNITDSALYGLYLITSSLNNITNNQINTTANSGYGIYLDGSLGANTNNNILSNIIITNGSSGYGIYFDSSENNNITGNTITTNTDGMYAIGAVSNIIRSNTITTNSTGRGINFITSSNRNIILNNTIITNGTGIEFLLSSNNNITNNTITSNTGILADGSSNFRIDGNTITTTGSGIYLVAGANSNTLQSNIINATGANADGIYIFSNSDSNTISYNNISKSGRSGVRLEVSGANTPDYNVLRENRIVYSNYSAINIIGATVSTTIIGGLIANSSVGVNATLRSRGINLTNVTIQNSTLFDFYIIQNSSVLALNSTFNKSAVNVSAGVGVDVSNLTIKWFLQVNVTNATNSPISSANVTAYLNKSNESGWTWQWNESTNSAGMTSVQEGTEFFENATARIYYQHNVTGNKTDYNANYTTFDLNRSRISGDAVWLVLPVTAPPGANNPPSDPSPRLVSLDGSNSTAQDLNCSANITDPDSGNLLNVTIKWYNNNTLNLTMDYNSSYANGTEFSALLDDGNTTKNDTWICSMRLYDSQDYSSWVNSSSLRILNSLPNVSLTNPPHGNITTNRTPQFTWAGSDLDGDSLEYEFNITCYYMQTGRCSADDRYVTKDTIGGTASYTISPYMRYLVDNNYYYNWTVRAFDGESYGIWVAVKRNISIQSDVSISLPVSEVNFGSINVTQAKNTTTNSPAPLVLRNDGNTELNVSVNFTALFSSVGHPSNYFQYKIRNTSAGCFLTSGTQTGWAQASAITAQAINRMNFTSGYQTGCSNTSVDLLVEVPADEPAGDKASIITFISSLGEPGMGAD